MNGAGELVEAGALLARAGLSPGSTGNLSVREGEDILCTPSGTRLGSLSEGGFSLLSASGDHIGGPRPTKEWPMHVACYQAAPNIGAVVHLHSTYATAWSVLADVDPDDALPPLTPYLAMKAGRVKVVPYARPGAPSLATYAAEAFDAGYRALLMSNHGSLVAGSSVGDAVAVAEELEESAKLALLLRGLPVRALDAAQVAELRPH